MSSFYAELTVDGQTPYPLRQCQYEFTQATDQRGRAVAKVRHGLLHLTLDVPTDDQLLDWANTVHKPLAGHVTFFEDDRRTARETVSFAAGQCVSYQESFVAGDGEAGAYVCQLLITSAGLTLAPGGAAQAFVAPAAREYAAPTSAGMLSLVPIVPAQVRPSTSNAPLSNVIKLSGGTKGGWNKTLNGELSANTIYEVDSIIYKTDSLGRVESTFIPKLKINPRSRNTYQQTKSVSSKDGQSGDQGGHIVAARLGGPGEQINYHPMKGNLNQGAWKKMENDWAKSIKDGQPVENVEVKAVFSGISKRPDGFIVDYLINNQKLSRTFVN